MESGLCMAAHSFVIHDRPFGLRSTEKIQLLLLISSAFIIIKAVFLTSGESRHAVSTFPVLNRNVRNTIKVPFSHLRTKGAFYKTSSCRQKSGS